MNSFKIAITSLIVALGIGIQAHAGFLVEPFFNQSVSGDFELGNLSADLSNTIFGARLGLTTLGFMYGVEYATGNFSVDFTNGKLKGDTTDIGLFVGYNFPIMFRAWFSYYLSSRYEFNNSNQEFKGTGSQIGIGYTGLPFISINLLMLNRTFDELDGSGSIDPKIKHSAYLIGVSLPLP